MRLELPTGTNVIRYRDRVAVAVARAVEAMLEFNAASAVECTVARLAARRSGAIRRNARCHGEAQWRCVGQGHARMRLQE